MKEKKIIFALLFISIAFFFAFGFYHIAKFETVDEHFWRYDRTPKYWEALKNQEWKKTYINDKPGITVALVSGLGLPFSPDPEKHRIRDDKSTLQNELTVYDSTKTEDINLALRLPILIFNGLFLLFLFWIIRKVTDSGWMAAFSVLFIALSPILIGISQIMNPDSFLWSFSAGALFSYLAHLKFPHEKKYIILTGVLLGFSLLSKYTANILFPLYFLLLIANYFFDFEHIEKVEGTKKYFVREVAIFFLLFVISVVIFSVFLPSVFVKSVHLYRGTIGFPGLKILILPMLLVFAATLFDIFALRGKNIKKISSFIFDNRELFLKIVSVFAFLVFAVILINCWTDQKMVEFDRLRAEAYFEEEMTWGGLLDNHSLPIRLAKEFLVEAYPFVFSIIPLSLFLVLALWIKIIWKGQKNNILLIFFLTILPMIYFAASLISKVLTNPRYSIMLYAPFALLSAIALNEFVLRLKNKNRLMMPAFALVIILFGLIALWTSKPFYFNYTSDLLPKKFTITDAWGYGEYEAAQYLNSLPNAEKLLIWSDRSAICQFIKGACIRDYKIDLTKVTPDYFVISKRGTIRHQFIWDNPTLAKKSSFEYYSDDLVNKPVWSLYIHNRPDNFVKVIKAIEK